VVEVFLVFIAIISLCLCVRVCSCLLNKRQTFTEKMKYHQVFKTLKLSKFSEVSKFSNNSTR